MHSILQRIRELSVQAQNGTLSSSDTAAIDHGGRPADRRALAHLREHCSSTASTSCSGTFTLQVGADQGSGNQISFSLTAISFSAIGSAASATAISDIDAAITSVSTPLHAGRDPEPARGHRRQPRRLPGEHLRRTEPHPRRRRRRRDGQLHQAADPLPVRYRQPPRRTPRPRTSSRPCAASSRAVRQAATRHEGLWRSSG